MTNCKAQRINDEMHCYRCNLYWDVKDDPVDCLEESELEKVNVGTVSHVEHRKTVISSSVEEAAVNSIERLTPEQIKEKFKDI